MAAGHVASAKTPGARFVAQFDYAASRSSRVASLRGEEATLAAQPEMIDALAQAVSLTDDGRADVAEKLTVFRMRLDETAAQIETLPAVPAPQWTQADDAMQRRMSRLAAARDAAWDALRNAPRTDRST